MTAELIVYILAFVPGILLLCTADIRGTCAGFAEICVAIVNPQPWCWVGVCCLIPLVYLVGHVAVACLENSLEA